MTTHLIRNKANRTGRLGAVSVEVAICIPVVFLFLLGTLEFSRVNMLRSSIDNAAYEGARRGVVPGATTEDCIQQAAQILRAVGLRQATVTVTPSTINDSTPQVTVEVVAPMSENGWGLSRFLSGVTLRSHSTKPRESVGEFIAEGQLQ